MRKNKINNIFYFYFYIVFILLDVVTAFCAIYVNTQIAFIKDSLLSSVLGFFTPFIIYLFPCLFRLISLKCKCCNLSFMYTLSEIIPLF